MSKAPKILLAHYLKTLKLPTFLREYANLACQCATEGLDHVQFLARLFELELIDRERRMVERRIKAAKFRRPRAGLMKHDEIPTAIRVRGTNVLQARFA